MGYLMFEVEYRVVRSDYLPEFLEWLAKRFGVENKILHFSLSRADLDREYSLLKGEEKETFKDDYLRFRELLGEDEETEFCLG